MKKVLKSAFSNQLIHGITYLEVHDVNQSLCDIQQIDNFNFMATMHFSEKPEYRQLEIVQLNEKYFKYTLVVLEY